VMYVYVYVYVYVYDVWVCGDVDVYVHKGCMCAGAVQSA